MKLFLHEVRTEQLLFWRNREAAFFTFFLPILFFLIFGSIYGNSIITKEHIRAAPFLQAGMIGYGVASTAFAGLAITMVIRRESGVLKRIRATPLPPTTYLLAVLASTFIVFLIEAALIIVIGRLLFHIGFPDRLGSLFVVLAARRRVLRRDGARPDRGSCARPKARPPSSTSSTCRWRSSPARSSRRRSSRRSCARSRTYCRSPTTRS